MNIEQLDKVVSILSKNLYMVVSTSTTDGKPWVSPVYFAHDEKYNFYWASSKESLHSRLIAQNSSVAAVVFDSSVPEGMGDGVYMVGQAKELTGGEINPALELYTKKKVRINPTYKRADRVADDFMGQSPWRLYKITPQKMWTLKAPVEIKGYPSEFKEEVNIEELLKIQTV